jgi:hypothetical protein
MATEPVSLESAYDYYVALANALQLTKEARDEATGALHKGVSDQQPAATLLTTLKTSQLDYACAQRYIEGYTKSKNDGIQVSAAGVMTGLQALQAIEHAVEKDITDMLDGKGTNAPEGTRARRIADENVQFNDAWQTLMMGVVASSHAAPHFSNDRFDGLTLSATQRADVIRRFEALGPDVEHEDNNPPLETAVAMLLKFLQDKRLKSYGAG